VSGIEETDVRVAPRPGAAVLALPSLAAGYCTRNERSSPGGGPKIRHVMGRGVFLCPASQRMSIVRTKLL